MWSICQSQAKTYFCSRLNVSYVDQKWASDHQLSSYTQSGSKKNPCEPRRKLIPTLNQNLNPQKNTQYPSINNKLALGLFYSHACTMNPIGIFITIFTQYHVINNAFKNSKLGSYQNNSLLNFVFYLIISFRLISWMISFVTRVIFLGFSLTQFSKNGRLC